MEYVIALGANLGDRARNMDLACRAIRSLVGHISCESKIYSAIPLLNRNGETGVYHPEYLNAVVVVESCLSPFDVLAELHRIEHRLGRLRRFHSVTSATNLSDWSSRMIDLDIVCADSIVMESPTLTIPHPRMHERDFVLEPLESVIPHWVHPKLGINVSELLVKVRKRYICGCA